MAKRIFVFIFCLCVTHTSFSIQSSVLSIEVSGVIYPQPYWTAAGSQQTSVTYTFSSYSQGTTGNYDLDSAATPVQLVVAAGAPVTSTIALATPGDCSVGTGNTVVAIPDGNIKLVTSEGIERASGNLTASLFTQANQTTKLRMKAIPSAATGNVTCGTPGSLTYSF